MTTIWYALDRRFTPGHLGYLPEIITADDSRPVREQLEDRYRHGGGFSNIDGFELDHATMALIYPEDPPLYPLAKTHINDETVFFYLHDILMILQKNGSYAVTRVD